ncbi:hypothetical protein [Hyalangium minutum]|uniref:Uncharacterized protein n=1 Tax=Hyalangium minutum TaxID=394096 RepID=A0A085VSU1_9BACT|nr:hypothetical protein [Hyalangium minutum]KFE58504.1 hypothetical protein DB31_6267 [Hyalangium minutum]KFE58520.1 hypothetical protein DB31_6241 [Hyalangium minutum]
MGTTFVNHHIYQEGDAYGLVYALLLSRAKLGDPMRGLLWVDEGLYDDGIDPLLKKAVDYKRKVDGRLGYFSSFGLLDSELCIVRCRFEKDVDLVEFHEEPGSLLVIADKDFFNSNPRLLSRFLTTKENPIGGWLEEKEAALALKVDERSLEHAAAVLGISLSGRVSWSNAERLRGFLRVHSFYKEAALDVMEVGLVARRRQEFSDAVMKAFHGGKGQIAFAYIDASTNYVLSCVDKKGFAPVVSALRLEILNATSKFSQANEKFISTFVEDLELRKGGVREATPVLVLFWIRGAKPDEERAILADFGLGQERTSPGKPQHHTNFTLYKQVRQIVSDMAAELNAPIRFIPIGDELKEELGKLSAPISSRAMARGEDLSMGQNALEHTAMVLGISLYENLSSEDRTRIQSYLLHHYGISEKKSDEMLTLSYRKSPSSHNLIRFWEREPFKGQPMGAQINFLLNLSLRYPVIQIGMRSGSMERLMYLGVPTIYFDRTQSEDDLQNPVGATRIKQLCGFQGRSLQELMAYLIRLNASLDGGGRGTTKGFPLFFQIENRDTGFLRYSALQNTTVSRTIERIAGSETLSEYNSFKQALLQKKYLTSKLSELARSLLHLGGLVDEEEQKMRALVWFIVFAYPRYASRFPNTGITAKLKLFGKIGDTQKFFQQSSHKEKSLEQLKQAFRADKKVSKTAPESKVGDTIRVSDPSTYQGFEIVGEVTELTETHIKLKAKACYQTGTMILETTTQTKKLVGTTIDWPRAVQFKKGDRIRMANALFHPGVDVVGEVIDVDTSFVTLSIDKCYKASTTTNDVTGAKLIGKKVKWRRDRVVRKEG